MRIYKFVGLVLLAAMKENPEVSISKTEIRHAIKKVFNESDGDTVRSTSFDDETETESDESDSESDSESVSS